MYCYMLIPVLPREVIVHVRRTFINMRACVESVQVNIPASGTITGKHRYEEIKVTHPPPPPPVPPVADKEAGWGGQET